LCVCELGNFSSIAYCFPPERILFSPTFVIYSSQRVRDTMSVRRKLCVRHYPRLFALNHRYSYTKYKNLVVIIMIFFLDIVVGAAGRSRLEYISFIIYSSFLREFFLYFFQTIPANKQLKHIISRLL
jgi:hypothetical protein